MKTSPVWRLAECLQDWWRGASVLRYAGCLDVPTRRPSEERHEGPEGSRAGQPLCTVRPLWWDVHLWTLLSCCRRGGNHEFRRTTPMFEPQTWNVHTATLADQHRTNNMCDARKNGFKNMVGHNNLSLWTALDCLRKCAALVESEVYNNQRCQSPTKRARKCILVYQKKLKTLCLQFLSGQKFLAQFLRARGQCIRH